MSNVRAYSRRALLAGAAAAVSAPRARAQAPASPLKISVFSKHFHWTGIPEAARMAAEIGFDAVDLTVRKAGHVLPERVAEDLPRAVEAVRKAGLEVQMITTEIVDVRTPHAAGVLRAAKSLGIRYYRWGGFRWDAARPYPAQLGDFEARSRDLAAMNKEFGVCAMYHTHSGVGQFGASIWDLWAILHRLDNHYVGVNYDVGHATVEGGLGGWISTTRMTAGMMRGIALKDFYWGKNARGEWQPQWCALGEGMVNFSRFFSMIKEQRFHGPIQLHYEYPEMGAAHAGSNKLDIAREKFIAIMKRDLARVRALMKDAHAA